jgi:NADPH-dependent curcumin reductase CurA
VINRQWLLASHPTGAVERSHFTFTEGKMETAPKGAKVLVRNELLLCVPTIRNWISGNRSSYYPTVEIGQPVMAPAVGHIVASEDGRYPVGTMLVGSGSWQDYQWANPEVGYQIVPDDVASVDALGILGMNPLTAYFGLIDVGRPKPGEVLLVSGAAGSVGSVAAQIGRIHGARVIAICGGSEKARWLRDICGIPDVVDYKAENLLERLDALCPDGIDVFFDNVGGSLLRDVVARMRRRGRVALCGQIATYDAAAGDPPLDMMRIIYGAIELRGFLLPDFADRFPEAINQLVKWKSDGLLAHREDVRDGLLQLPATFASLFDGSNTGTLIARIATPAGDAI